jgi:preprotein translocase subunit SecA
MIPYDVQLFGAIQLSRGHIAEMKTGEGKTLTATLPVYLHALSDRGSHIVTVNDYLAKRDFETMSPIYRQLGLSVGVIQSDDLPEQRREAYRQDITYGTGKQFGFDFLRDRLAARSGGGRSTKVMRGLNFVLVDEADSVLIDEAGTPLIIGLVDSEQEALKQAQYLWAAEHADQFSENTDFSYDRQKRKVTLERMGMDRMRRLPENDSVRRASFYQLQTLMENAIKVRRDFHLDKQYVIREGKVAIVDEFTGRIAEGRKWQHGIHQAIEAKEAVEISSETGQGATVTMQAFFKRYEMFAGMTGTAITSKREFKKVFGKKVVRVPTNRPIRRLEMPVQIFYNEASKIAAIVRETESGVNQKRPILIGTRSIRMSELVAAALTEAQIEFQVLNANQDSNEAEVIAGSGAPGRVTVATNMAGRGTDIVLDDAVRNHGGLHVMLTEFHESQRIDWQLIGRGCRQGDPGSFRCMASLDDELLRLGLSKPAILRLKKRFASVLHNKTCSEDQNGETAVVVHKRSLPGSLVRVFRRAQRKLERQRLTDRLILLEQDQQKQQQHFEMGLDPFCDAV